MDITDIISGINRKLDTAGFKKIETIPSENFPALYLSEYKESTEDYIKSPQSYTANTEIEFIYVDSFTSEDSFNAISAQVKKLIKTLNLAEDILINPKYIKITYNSSEMEILFEEESRQTYASWKVSFLLEQFNATD